LTRLTASNSSMIQLRTGARFMYVLFTMIYHCFIGLLGWCLCLGLVIIVKIAIRQIFAILAQYSHFLARYTLARATQISFSIVGSAQIDRRATPSISKWDSVSGARRRAPLFCGFFSQFSGKPKKNGVKLHKACAVLLRGRFSRK